MMDWWRDCGGEPPLCGGTCDGCQEREALSHTLAGRTEALKNSHPIMRVWLDGLWIDAIWRAWSMPFRLGWSRIWKGRHGR